MSKTLKREVNKAIVGVMKANGISRADLHRSLKISRPSVTQILQPDRNLTLDVLERIGAALDHRVVVAFEPRKTQRTSEKRRLRRRGSEVFSSLKRI